ncbi:MAG TPA: hypothetical protein VEL47_02615 [Myxococcota bacterium]|nr:hypothetical protein [Myxococcota bacterium]
MIRTFLLYNGAIAFFAVGAVAGPICREASNYLNEELPAIQAAINEPPPQQFSSLSFPSEEQAKLLWSFVETYQQTTKNYLIRLKNVIPDDDDDYCRVLLDPLRYNFDSLKELISKFKTRIK